LRERAAQAVASFEEFDLRRQQIRISAGKPRERRRAKALIAVSRQRVQVVPIALAQAHHQLKTVRQRGHAIAVQPRLAEPGGDRQILAAVRQHAATPRLHRRPVGHLQRGLPDAGRHARIVRAARRPDCFVLRIVNQRYAAGLVARQRLQQRVDVECRHHP
jgi:hypothetical protein